MKTGLTDEINSVQQKFPQEMKEELKGTSAAHDVIKEVLQEKLPIVETDWINLRRM